MSISDTIGGLQVGNKLAINLGGMAESTSNAWPRGWYPLEVVEGFETRSGYQQKTEVLLSNNGDSFNLRLCFRGSRTVNGTPEVRMFNTQINYRTTDFSPETVEIVKRLRKELAGVQGAWPDEFKKYQASSLSLVKLGQLQNASGVELTIDDFGKFILAPIIGKKFFGLITVNQEGYNDVKTFSKFVNGVEPKKREKKSKS